MPDPETTFAFCSANSGKAGCVGERKVTKYGAYWFCVKCFPHRKRLAKQLDARRRN